MQAIVKSEIDPRDRTRTGYRITGPSFAAVQQAIDGIMNSPAVASSRFQIPIDDGEGAAEERFIAFGYTHARVS